MSSGAPTQTPTTIQYTSVSLNPGSFDLGSSRDVEMIPAGLLSQSEPHYCKLSCTSSICSNNPSRFSFFRLISVISLSFFTCAHTVQQHRLTQVICGLFRTGVKVKMWKIRRKLTQRRSRYAWEWLCEKVNL